MGSVANLDSMFKTAARGRLSLEGHTEGSWKNSNAKGHPPNPPSTAPKRCSTSSPLLGDRDPARRATQAPAPLFEQIWAQNGQIVAVQPHDDFLPYFQATQQFLQHQPTQGGAESGSDGTRTRDLCRDRPIWGWSGHGHPGPESAWLLGIRGLAGSGQVQGWSGLQGQDKGRARVVRAGVERVGA